MSSQDWERIEQIFHECLDLDAAARAAFLDRSCGDDTALRKEVEALLASQTQAGGFLESAIQDGAELAVERQQQPWMGRRLGPYEIVGEIGRGGMGAVFLAVRADEQFEKQVAIKVLAAGLGAEPLLRAFRQERQILAHLEHPYIARLLDGGATPEGVPYLVMEYVDGEPLLAYCDQRKLNVRERLALFLKVCEAVQYAHQNLVVHRDLKPGNILVTGEGDPKLLDFGVAKLIERPEAGAEQPAATITMFRALTPDYASPEQVEGRPVTTATDVYSLGALLYEILAGVRPHFLRGLTTQEITRAVCEEDPDPPSAAFRKRPEDEERQVELASRRSLSPGKLRRELQGDLDNIVLKAMRRNAGDRYSSAEQFAEDVRRHLQALPVTARKQTWRYGAAKFLRRHRLGVGVAATLLASVLAFTVVTVVQARRIARERDKATRVSEFLVQLFQVSDPSEARGRTITAREILDKGAASMTQELKSEPDVRATLLETMGRVYVGLGAYQAAAPLLREALEIRRRTHAGARELASSLVALGRACSAAGDYGEAEKLLAEAVAMGGETDPARREAFTNALSSLGVLYEKLERQEAAERAYRECLRIHRQSGVDTADTAVALENLGGVYLRRRDYAAAEKSYREALDMYRRTIGPDHPKVATALINLATLLRRKGDLTAAEPLYREGLDLMRKVYGERHPTYAAGLQRFGVFLRDKSEAEAEPVLREALQIEREILPEGHSETAAALVELGRCLMYQNRPREAEPLLREGVQIYEHLSPKGGRLRAGAEVSYGKTLVRLGRYRDAAPWLSDKYALYKKLYGESDQRTAALCGDLAALYKGLGDPAKAAEYAALKTAAAKR